MQRKKIIHRDLKPENILLSSEEMEDIDVRIADFGFAIEHQVGKSNVRCGTPGYIAPEILQGSEYTPKTDIYSIGVILYNIVSGKPLVTGKTVMEVIKATNKLNV